MVSGMGPQPPLEFQTLVPVAPGSWDCPLLWAELHPLSEPTCCLSTRGAIASNQQTLSEHLLHTGAWARYWGCHCSKAGPQPRGAPSLRGGLTINSGWIGAEREAGQGAAVPKDGGSTQGAL